jgi:hypothetical protein
MAPTVGRRRTDVELAVTSVVSVVSVEDATLNRSLRYARAIEPPQGVPLVVT